jgi:hypothetical protein
MWSPGAGLFRFGDKSGLEPIMCYKELLMALSEQRNRLADLLERVVDGKLKAGDALTVAESWTDMPWDQRDVNVAWHTLMHFNIDDDIRQKDPEYESRLREQLVHHISNLRAI